MSDSISLKIQDTKKAVKTAKEISQDLLYNLPKTIQHFFPQFYKTLCKLPDNRKRIKYTLPEIAMGGISMYMFKEGSRNSYNNDRQDDNFRKNYTPLFGNMFLPHMDTVDDLYRKMDTKNLEKVKQTMIKDLLKKRVLHKWRLKNKYFIVAVDGTEVMSFREKHCDKCLKKISKNGKQTWYHNVLEAKLVFPNGLSLSIGTEWIENDKSDYESLSLSKYKQDCEIKAFDRLAKKLKKDYPRLPLCIVGDGLYPNQRFFRICRENNWEYILTLKDGNLISVWGEVKLLLPISKNNNLKTRQILSRTKAKTNEYRWINNIEYKQNKLNWIENIENIKTEKEEETKRFVHISSMNINKKIAQQISFTGRLRWKIENEGFNTQKNGGYALEHKYSKVSLTASKNYYQSLQIASIINQLLVLGQKLKKYLRKKITIKHLWKTLISFLTMCKIDEDKMENLLNKKIQIRLE